MYDYNHNRPNMALGVFTPKATAGHGRVTLLLSPLKKGRITIFLSEL